jgi:ribosome biogenesis GTPase A
MDSVDLLEAVAKRRGFRLKGGEFDMEKTAVTFLVDYRSGAIGRVSLETPNSRLEMMIREAESLKKPSEATAAAITDELSAEE